VERAAKGSRVDGVLEMHDVDTLQDLVDRAQDAPGWEKLISRLMQAEKDVLVANLVAWQRARAGVFLFSSLLFPFSHTVWLR
jgi:hypothetical protein